MVQRIHLKNASGEFYDIYIVDEYYGGELGRTSIYIHHGKFGTEGACYFHDYINKGPYSCYHASVALENSTINEGYVVVCKQGNTELPTVVANFQKKLGWSLFPRIIKVPEVDISSSKLANIELD